ncbi:hypothetical protein PUN28_015421 [Cardiocondyla obscurior]|uniref:Uncharacterized protein n=1 Tax=Cardiocondyla obscurior TaxID=286306 RepID=A0AAW2EWQ0_9HYME
MGPFDKTRKKDFVSQRQCRWINETPISRPKVSSSSHTKETTKLVAQWPRHSRNTKVASLRCRIASWGARLLNFECSIRRGVCIKVWPGTVRCVLQFGRNDFLDYSRKMAVSPISAEQDTG